MKTVKGFIFLIALALLVFPMLQAKFHVIISKPLSGVFENAPPPVFSIGSWFRETYQEQAAKNFNDSLGFKSDFVRLYNQINFSLFDQVNAKKIICGKENYLYSDQYLYAYAGKDFAGKAVLDGRIKELKNLQDILWAKHRIFLLVVLCPDKPTFYPEYIPARFLSTGKKLTNAEYIARRCRETGVHLIDFNPWFLAMKDTARYPLYPKTGVHWSFYGAYFAADSLARYLSANTGFYIPRLVLDSLSKSKTPLAEDNDMGATLNLIWDIPCPEMAYPKFHEGDNPKQRKASALFVGDSFYWNWFNSGMIKTLFENDDFWYYSKDVYPGSRNKPVSVSDINIHHEIKKQNIIVLIQVNGAYGNIGYDFSKLALSAFDSANSKLIRIENNLRNNPEASDWIKKKAEKLHVRFEEQLRTDALFLLDQEEDKHQTKDK